MKGIVFWTFLVLSAGMVVSCAQPTPVLPPVRADMIESEEDR